ncbi:MAG: ABC-ATPase domain-containing protein [Planctomycetota bacterium]|jgi:predicted ABC-class ATPase
MKSEKGLQNVLHRINGKGYKAYKDIQGPYDFGRYVVSIDHVQGDPFASPSRVRIRMSQETAAFPADTFSGKSREVALRDFITRRFSNSIKQFCKGNRGSGKSGIISIDAPGQEILERTSALVTEQHVEARFVLGLPAFGRRVAAREAEAMFLQELPKIVQASLFFKNLDAQALYNHVKTAEDADFLRSQLDSLGLVAFVADGAILPRASGVDARPLDRKRAVPFQSPASMRVEVELPNRGKLTGMGVPQGITLIVGGGYHGKSTLLNALELGIYNHVPGDGREFVVTDPAAVKIRAEDGRRIEKVDISPFINNLPFAESTRAFSTENASGSTSQAANIIEAIEAGAKVLLIDEDTSATNFMIRDHRMQELVSKEKEPITPFIDKARQLYEELGISTILVIGGSGDYFDVADSVVCMVEYRPQDFTENAKAVAEKYRAERKPEGGGSFGDLTERIPLARSVDPSSGRRQARIKCNCVGSIDFGRHNIDLSSVEQLVHISQTRAIGDAIYYARSYMNGAGTLKEIIDAVLSDVNDKGLDALSRVPAGNYACFRELELAAALNRLRSLSVNQKKSARKY